MQEQDVTVFYCFVVAEVQLKGHPQNNNVHYKDNLFITRMVTTFI